MKHISLLTALVMVMSFSSSFALQKETKGWEVIAQGTMKKKSKYITIPVDNGKIYTRLKMTSEAKQA